LDNRAKFIALIRQYEPDIIFTHRLYDYHPDHRVTSQLVQDSSYAVLVPSVLPLRTPLRAKPIIVYMHDPFVTPIPLRPDIVVDIDEVSRQKLQMIHCHASQMYEWLPWMDGELESIPQEEEDRLAWLAGKMARRDGALADRFRRRLMDRYGDTRGEAVRCAEIFEISEYGAQPPADAIDRYFPL
ncbi:MAG: LmbE family protein, partial [Paenibacillus sp.]|nr:LmbE family protein [Paenibacillus sp.]